MHFPPEKAVPGPQQVNNRSGFLVTDVLDFILVISVLLCLAALCAQIALLTQAQMIVFNLLNLTSTIHRAPDDWVHFPPERPVPGPQQVNIRLGFLVTDVLDFIGVR